jgi:neopullulanase
MKKHLPFQQSTIALLFFLFIALQSFGQQSPWRVEPPFWWTDMHHSELQLLVYGENIALTRARINYPGVTLKEVVSTENPNYLFLYLEISDEVQPGKITIDFVSGRRTQFTYAYELRQRKENARYHKGFDASDAIYLLMPDRFANGNPANDNVAGMLEKADRSIPNGRHGGDIEGILQNLDYIQNFGFTALWINPLLENNQPRYSYHGYAITDFYNIDPRFGGNTAYVKLIAEAENRGMKIIKDMVLNHCGHHHWWIKDLPSSDWLNQWPEFTRTTYRMTTIFDPHAAQSDYQRMMDGWFDTNMPDLNQRNRLLATYLIQNSVWWIEYAGIHGIRMDTQPYADKDFMADWAKYIMDEYPDFNIVGEAWTSQPAMVSYFQGGKTQYDGYNSNVPSVFDFSMYDAIGEAFNEEQGWGSGMMRVYNSLAMDFMYADPYNLVIFGDNHDTDRIFTRLNENMDNLKLATALLLTTRGIPQFYTGTELLESAYEGDGHGLLRANFPGGWPGDEINAFKPEGRDELQNEIYRYMSRLLLYRKNKEVLHYGWLKQFVPQDNIYVYFRYNDKETVMVVLNNNENEMTLDLSRFVEATQGFNSAFDIIDRKSFSLTDTWTIPAKKALVMELK